MWASVVSDSLRPYGPLTTRLFCPGDSPGKNTGVGCHALLPNPGISSQSLPNPGIEPRSLMSPALAGGFFTTSATWEAHSYVLFTKKVKLGDHV